MSGTLHHCERSRRRAKLAGALERLGWRIDGYKEDNSDIQTDYFDPANWNGCARKTTPAGSFLVFLDWYQHAWPDPNPAETDRIGAVIKARGSRLSWTVARVTDAGDLVVVLDGTGLWARGNRVLCTLHEEATEDERIVAMIAAKMDAVTAATAKAPRPAPVAVSEVTVTPSTVRDGNVEIRFPAKPSDETRARLKLAGFRWSGTAGCWYGSADALPADLRPAPAPQP